MITLSPEQELLVSSVEDIAEREFADRAFDWGSEPPWENVQLLADHGFLGVNFSEEYGGMTELDAILTIEAVGRVCPDTAEFLYNQQLVAPRAIELFGTDAAKERYFPPVLGGEESIAIGISEPEASSDVGAVGTRVEENGSELVLNGEKTWVSNVEHSSAVLVWTKFPGGLGSVIVKFGHYPLGPPVDDSTSLGPLSSLTLGATEASYGSRPVSASLAGAMGSSVPSPSARAFS